MADEKKDEAPKKAKESPIWPQGPDYNPREDSGPVRPEDKNDNE